MNKIDSFKPNEKPNPFLDDHYRARIIEITRSKCWGNREGDFAYGSLVKTNCGYFIVGGVYDDEDLCFDEVFKVDESTIQKFTGLSDLNDRKVYSGDNFWHNDEVLEVTYEIDKGGWLVYNVNDGEGLHPINLGEFIKYGILNIKII